tara:strand:+ start:11050 stop:11376 length:327 start_codon:yes stop_codon:yes gene_type:complete
MLLSISFELTLVARDIYGPSDYRQPIKLASDVSSISPDYTDAMKLTFARGLSELHHQISSYLRSKHRSDPQYSDDVFIGVLCDVAEGHGMGDVFTSVWQKVYLRLTER